MTNNQFKSTTMEDHAKRMVDLMSKVMWAGDFPPSASPYTAKPISRWARVRRWIALRRPIIHWGPCVRDYCNCDEYDED